MGNVTWGRWTVGAWHRSVRLEPTADKLLLHAACGWHGPVIEVERAPVDGPESAKIPNVCAYCRIRSK